MKRSLPEIEAEITQLKKRLRVLNKEHKDAFKAMPVEDDMEDTLPPPLLKRYTALSLTDRVAFRITALQLAPYGLLDLNPLVMGDRWMWQCDADHYVILNNAYSAMKVMDKTGRGWWGSPVSSTTAMTTQELFMGARMQEFIADITKYNSGGNS